MADPLPWDAGSTWNFEDQPLDTPVPVIDWNTAERNIIRTQRICDEAGVANRPHIKTHKSVELARLQIRHGAAGITCQKLGEAEVMADAGIDDILISYNILGAAKHPRLARLNSRVSLTVACDNWIVAMDLGKAVAGSGKRLRVLVECDTGRERCGVATPEAAASLAQAISELPDLAFAGLLLYPPNGACAEARAFVDETRGLCAQRGLDIETVSAGGTPNLAYAGQFSETEFRAGTCIFNDRQMVSLGAARPQDCALFVYSTVVSHPASNRVMLDAGSKALTSELVGFADYGFFPDYPQARLVRFAEEHGFVDVSDCPNVPAIGEIVRVLPNHVCPVVNMYDEIQTVRDGVISSRLNIDARGRVA